MSLRSGFLPLLACAALLYTSQSASAARVRFHYVPAGNGCPMTLAPIGSNVFGERIGTFSTSPYCVPPPRATFMGTYRHPISGCTLVVPLGLPADTPTIQHRSNRVVYNYGSFTVDVVFLEDGSVDVIYSNGLFRDI